MQESLDEQIKGYMTEDCTWVGIGGLAYYDGNGRPMTYGAMKDIIARK